MIKIKNILVIVGVSGLVVYVAAPTEIALAIVMGALLGLIGHISTRAILNADLTSWFAEPEGQASSHKHV